MAYVPSENKIGVTAFTQLDTTTGVPFGTIVRGNDTASGKGGGEFIYLPGTSGTVVGSLVVYDPFVKSTTLTPNTANLGQPLAVAMAANNTTTSFGWYQIMGVAVVKKTAIKVGTNVAVFLSATIGRVTSSIGAGKQILNARAAPGATTAASATSTVQVLINRPFAQGQTT